MLTFSDTGANFASTVLTVPVSGTATVTTGNAGQQRFPVILCSSVTLSGNVTIQLNGIIGLVYLDTSGIVVGGNTVTIANGSGTFVATTLIATKKLLAIYCSGANALTVG